VQVSTESETHAVAIVDECDLDVPRLPPAAAAH
jgi:hypothetical protein